MELRFSLRFAWALFLLTLLLGEAHEQAHIQFGRWVCGCYGGRDFSAWAGCIQCGSPAWAPFSSLTGPLFTYAVIWLGAWLAWRGRSKLREVIGLALVFAALPFARIVTVLTGSGDEAAFFRQMIGPGPGAMVLAVLLVFLMCWPPILVACSRLAPRRRGAWVAALCVLPLFAQGAYVRLFMNKVLDHEVLASPSIAGTPALILVHTAVVAAVFMWVTRSLLRVHPESTPP